MPYKNQEDRRRAWREHYARNRDYYIARSAARKREIKAFVTSLKEGRECLVCGGSFGTRALDWHHRDQSQKLFNIANAVINGYSKKRILAEIEKCDLICSNCHRVK